MRRSSRHGGRAALMALLVAGAACASARSRPTPAPPTDAAPAVEYRSARGVVFRAQADTGGVARAARALAADPRNPARYLDLGLAQAAVRQYQEAVATFTRGLALAPNDAVLYRWRGHRFISLGDFDRALTDLTRGVRLDSTNYGIWYHLGIARYAHGDFAGAADAFAHAQPLAPDGGELAGATDWRWMALSRAGRGADAAAMLARRPDSLPVTNAYARRLRLYRGELAPDRVLTPADTDAVTVATLSYGVGTWYLTRGDTAQARTWYDRAVRANGWPAFGFLLAEREQRHFGAP